MNCVLRARCLSSDPAGAGVLWRHASPEACFSRGMLLSRHASLEACALEACALEACALEASALEASALAHLVETGLQTSGGRANELVSVRAYRICGGSCRTGEGRISLSKRVKDHGDKGERGDTPTRTVESESWGSGKIWKKR